MKSRFVDDKDITKLLSNIRKDPLDYLKEIHEFNFNSINISDESKCENIVGVDGSVKLIAERLNYFYPSENNYKTYLIDPVIFVRSVSIHASQPFIKEDKIITIEKLNQKSLDEYLKMGKDRKSSIIALESEELQKIELEHINDIIDEMDNSSILLLDMALYRRQNEDEINDLILKCQNKDITVVGWSKDSDIRTDDGLLYTEAAKSAAKDKKIKPPWFAVHPKFKDKDINVFLYHPPWGNFVFRTDIVPSSLNINEIFNVLISCSKHSLGYPLVLYKAHQRVKITQNDANNMFRKMKKISASNNIFINKISEKPFHETYLDL